jgi:hypothetical protein
MPQSALEKDTPAEAAFPASGSSPGREAWAEDQNRRVKPRWRLQTARPDQLKNKKKVCKICLPNQVEQTKGSKHDKTFQMFTLNL